MVLTTAGNAGEFVQLIADNFTYLGPRDLTQYFIRETSMDMSEDGAEIVMQVQKFISFAITPCPQNRKIFINVHVKMCR